MTRRILAGRCAALLSAILSISIAQASNNLQADEPRQSAQKTIIYELQSPNNNEKTFAKELLTAFYDKAESTRIIDVTSKERHPKVVTIFVDDATYLTNSYPRVQFDGSQFEIRNLTFLPNIAAPEMKERGPLTWRHALSNIISQWEFWTVVFDKNVQDVDFDVIIPFKIGFFDERRKTDQIPVGWSINVYTNNEAAAPEDIEVIKPSGNLMELFVRFNLFNEPQFYTDPSTATKDQTAAPAAESSGAHNLTGCIL